MLNAPLRLAALAILVVLGGCASTSGDTPFATRLENAPVWEAFAPGDEDNAQAIDYSGYEAYLQAIVLNVGRTDRDPSPAPDSTTGSRIRRQHTGRYRLLTNRITFSLQPDSLKAVSTQIVDGFTAIANTEALYTLSKDEQLAFWINFHNALLIREMTVQYPFIRLDSLKATNGGGPVFQAKLVEVRGVPLSLDDIRTNIVYRHFDNPVSPYGFYTGAIGGPNIRNRAYTAARVDRMLRENAVEFINSLRGVENDEKNNRISRIYRDVGPLFDYDEAALIEHLYQFTEPKTALWLSPTAKTIANVYDWAVADLSYGDAAAVIGQIEIDTGLTKRGAFGGVGLSPQSVEVLREMQIRRLNFLRDRKTEVIINDVDTDDDEDEKTDEDSSSDESE